MLGRTRTYCPGAGSRHRPASPRAAALAASAITAASRRLRRRGGLARRPSRAWRPTGGPSTTGEPLPGRQRGADQAGQVVHRTGQLLDLLGVVDGPLRHVTLDGFEDDAYVADRFGGLVGGGAGALPRGEDRVHDGGGHSASGGSTASARGSDEIDGGGLVAARHQGRSRLRLACRARAVRSGAMVGMMVVMICLLGVIGYRWRVVVMDATSPVVSAASQMFAAARPTAMTCSGHFPVVIRAHFGVRW